MHRQTTVDERYTLGALRRTGRSGAAIARALGRHRSTIWREVRRNRAAGDGTYRPQLAEWYARRRLLQRDWSPDQVAGYLRRHHQLRISHETTYRHIWADKRAGGELYRHLRGAQKRYRKRYGQRDSRGRLTQAACTAIARRLNQRPRRRLDYRTPEECYAR